MYSQGKKNFDTLRSKSGCNKVINFGKVKFERNRNTYHIAISNKRLIDYIYS